MEHTDITKLDDRNLTTLLQIKIFIKSLLAYMTNEKMRDYNEHNVGNSPHRYLVSES